MPELKFDKLAERFYETGVSKGVLFVKKDNAEGYDNGVVWNGLTSVTESPEGAEETALYADNIKYLSLRSAEDFKATIEAYTYPDAFKACNGEAQLGGEGVTISQQPRKSFCFCYQTKKGSAENPELGYIIHLVYGATASPTEKAYETVNDSPDAITFSYEISTVPVEIGEGFKPTAHLEIDSTKIAPTKLTEILEALYGTDPAQGESGGGEVSHVLMPDDILAIMKKN